MDKERMDELAGDPRFIPGIYIKLCRAATGMIRGELEGNEFDPQDANGSAKVALLGIERSLAAWATLRRRFPDHEDIILALGTLKRLLRQVEAAFPNARAFRRPGFDTMEGPDWTIVWERTKRRISSAIALLRRQR
jgi:hypothetical protein